MQEKIQLFVYGTLKKGHFFHESYLGHRDTRFLGDFCTDDNVALYIGEYPFAVEEKSDKGISGELYEINKKMLPMFDYLEGHPHIYERKVIKVFDDNGDEKEAWCYF